MDRIMGPAMLEPSAGVSTRRKARNISTAAIINKIEKKKASGKKNKYLYIFCKFRHNPLFCSWKTINPPPLRFVFLEGGDFSLYLAHASERNPVRLYLNLLKRWKLS